MPHSLANGDYSLVMAIESSSRANSWYRVLADRRTGSLSCDCPAWTFRQDDGQIRSCKHTHLAQQLASAQQVGTPVTRANGAAAETNLLIQATRQQWPGLGGRWGIEQHTYTFDNTPYSFILLRLATGNGAHTTGLVAFAQRYHPTQESMVAGAAGWAGYAIAAEVARQAGYPLAGQPPDHFKITRRDGTGMQRRRIGLGDILRVGDQIDLGDGYTPVQRAENTLHLFLGKTLYTQLEHRHFLDVSSIHYADRQRVYRLRRDPHKNHERRIRIFEYGEYINDYCVVRSQDVPEGDHFLTVFLGLLSDEQTTLSVVGRGNIFPPYSDGREQETIPVTWQPRVA